MNSLLKLNRRGLVRIISFTVALIVALTAASASAFAMAKNYRTTVEYTYQRALQNLSEYINSLDVTLEKGQYANTSKQMQGLASKLWQDAGYAKSSLAELPVTGDTIGATSKFLSQVGNFCVTLSNRVAAGGNISEKELSTLDQLAGYAGSISEKVAKMISDLESGKLKIGEVKSVIKKEDKSQKTPGVDSGFKEIEEGFSDYPTMIYDGPFSDHILRQKPKLLEGKPQVTVEKALQTAKSFTKVTTLKHSGDTEGNLPCYNFTVDSITASVTKADGVVDYFLNSRTIGEPTMSDKDAVKLAEKALTNMGMKGFKYRYFAINDGILTVNFAATQDGVILYPDLIKVGIAMDDGSVVSYDAKGYIMNHKARNLPQVKVSESAARDVLSARLTPETHALALIPMDGLSEVLCHEFFCRGKNDERVLVYINAQTGMEEQILIIIQDETGVLAM